MADQQSSLRDYLLQTYGLLPRMAGRRSRHSLLQCDQVCFALDDAAIASLKKAVTDPAVAGNDGRP